PRAEQGQPACDAGARQGDPRGLRSGRGHSESVLPWRRSLFLDTADLSSEVVVGGGCSRTVATDPKEGDVRAEPPWMGSRRSWNTLPPGRGFACDKLSHEEQRAAPGKNYRGQATARFPRALNLK